MKNIFKFITFVICTVIIFFINDFIVLGFIFTVNVIVSVFLKINFKNMVHSIKIFLPFILFTVLINVLISNLYDGILVGVRIFICYYFTYIFASTITILEIAKTIEILCFPLKLLKVNTRSIGIIVSIAICMIPIVSKEIRTTIQSLRARGGQAKVNNLSILMKPILISILQRTNQMEKTLIAKGYVES